MNFKKKDHGLNNWDTKWEKKEPLEMYEMTFNHIHYAKGFTVLSKHPETTHACLSSGYWCWSNLRERPKDIIRYIEGKIKELEND